MFKGTQRTSRLYFGFFIFSNQAGHYDQRQSVIRLPKNAAFVGCSRPTCSEEANAGSDIKQSEYTVLISGGVGLAGDMPGCPCWPQLAQHTFRGLLESVLDWLGLFYQQTYEAGGHNVLPDGCSYNVYVALFSVKQNHCLYRAFHSSFPRNPEPQS